MMYKTKMCDFSEKPRGCVWGDRCHHAHSLAELRFPRGETVGDIRKKPGGSLCGDAAKWGDGDDKRHAAGDQLLIGTSVVTSHGAAVMVTCGPVYFQGMAVSKSWYILNCSEVVVYLQLPRDFICSEKRITASQFEYICMIHIPSSCLLACQET